MDDILIKEKLYHYNKAIQENLQTAIEPLTKNFGLKTFSYLRFYNDGRYLNLCTDLNWHQFILQQPRDGESFAESLKQIPVKKLHQVHWPQNLQDPIMQALHGHNIWNGLSFYYVGKNYTEAWAFSGTPNDNEIINHISNHQKLYKQYIRFFKKQYKHIYEGYDHKNLPIFETEIPEMHHDENKCNTELEEKFMQEWKGVLETLSPRERECLKYLKQGYTAKEMARPLVLSHRTVEHYIGNMLKKYNCRKTAELLNKLDDDDQLE